MKFVEREILGSRSNFSVCSIFGMLLTGKLFLMFRMIVVFLSSEKSKPRRVF